MNVVVTESTSIKISRIIERILADVESEQYIYKFEEPIDIRPILRRENVLPMMFDWSGFYGVRPNGEIVVVDLGPPYRVRAEKDPRICRMVLFQGIKRHPELTELAPVKTAETVKCLSCNGTGREPMNDKLGFEDERIVCWCGGLGWLPKDEYQPAPSDPQLS